MKKETGLISLTLITILLATALVVSGYALFQWLASKPEITAEAPTETPNLTLTSSQESPPPLEEPFASDKPVQKHTDAHLAASSAGFDLSVVGSRAWSDDEFYRLTQLLKDNPEVIEPLALEYRETTEHYAQMRLALLLGQFDAPLITDIGVELALSGDPESQRSGLRLLGKQQARVPRARKTIADLMSVETQPEVLKAALNAMAKPAETDALEHKDLLGRFTRLSDNPDPTIRALSISVIAVWSDEMDSSEVLIKALDDSSPQVRESAAFAFLKAKHLSADAKYKLLAKIEDTTEKKRARQAALQALRRFDLSEDEKARYEIARQAVQLAPKN